MNKLPPEIRQYITRENGSTEWTLRNLLRCLSHELDIMEAGYPFEKSERTVPYVSTAAFYTKSRENTLANKKGRTTCTNGNRPQSKSTHIYDKPCIFCNEIHAPVNCENITNITARTEIIKRANLCFNCFRSHKVADCRSKYNCRKCHKKHHTSICNTGAIQQKSDTTYTPTNSENKTKTTLSILHSGISKNVLLKTAVTPLTYNGLYHDTNILFDEGAQRSFITESIAELLKIQPIRKERLTISGFEQSTPRTRLLDVAKVYVVTENKQRIPVEVLIIPKIGNPIAASRKGYANLPYLKGLKLAMPMNETEYFEVDMLIGADYYWTFVGDQIVRGNGPTAVSSKLGFLLSGPTQEEQTHSDASIMDVLVSHKEEECELEKFWNVESLGIKDTQTEEDYESYLENYQHTSISYKDGKYIAKLPWKLDQADLPTNETTSRRRTENVIRRLARKPEMLKLYGDIIKEQESRGFIEKVSHKKENSLKVHYIPHHPVKKDSTTTPIRIVYDCSCKQDKYSPSLNDCLCSTPPILNELTGLLVRFRMKKYGISTDIEKAFLHVGLDKDDRDVTRFFWLSDPSDSNSPLCTYRFKSVLFGATCSPFILNATLLKHLSDGNTPLENAIKRDLYVDNIITSVDTETECIDYFNNSQQSLMKAGFNLRVWSSNSEKLRKKAVSENVLDKDEKTKLLGMRWDAESDILTFATKRDNTADVILVTKCEILRESSSIYDPLGILSPVTVRAKLLIQKLWKDSCAWDVELDEKLQNEWNEIYQDIKSVQQETKLSRYYFSRKNKSDGKAVLHVFVDASQKSYGACTYIVRNGETAFVMAKNRVAPIKGMTLPRLELMAAVIGT